ncbi:DUF3549 family protein [Psychrobium sp. 1_MG-2023]|uniref:DUF3549 family protein n=1 Tax=Psychrobium sp. 1_MG-2023 TaxID=3062624 RepID=UPI0026A42728|nr:DUF3549 family protein [Psychrobium sp. 1_MG-2023]MDP2560528.1 DUF3549 family protein [Psychrobium sp. 1_MG-2023]
MDQFNTLSEFLLQAGTQYRVFDMGRRVQKISTDLFSDFEHAVAPYPYPLQQHAWLAVLFWNKQQSQEHYVWFLKLPLDERGLLEQASRNQFLELVVNALGKSMNKEPDQEQQSALDHNPIIFKPSEQKLAAFTSQVRQVMKLAPSSYMTPALDYLNTPEQHSQWQEIGYQGLADIASKADDPLFNQAIVNALPVLPSQTFCALCCSLENIAIDTAIADVLLNQLKQAINESDLNHVIHAARALSHAKGPGFQQQALDALYSSELIKTERDIVVIIAGRYWQLITTEDSALLFLEAVATLNVEQDIFNQLFSDVVGIPTSRTAMLSALRNPQRSEKLAHYIAKLISG